MLFIILPRYATDIDDDIHSFLHRLYADKLVWTMEVDAAGEDIRTRKSTEAELGAISAATNRLHLWSDTTFLHGPEHYVDDVHLWLNLLLHIIVLVFDLYRRCAVAIFLVDLVNTFGYKTFTCLEALTVVVADDIAERGEFGMAQNLEDALDDAAQSMVSESKRRQRFTFFRGNGGFSSAKVVQIKMKN